VYGTHPANAWKEKHEHEETGARGNWRSGCLCSLLRRSACHTDDRWDVSWRACLGDRLGRTGAQCNLPRWRRTGCGAVGGCRALVVSSAQGCSVSGRSSYRCGRQLRERGHHQTHGLRTVLRLLWAIRGLNWLQGQSPKDCRDTIAARKELDSKVTTGFPMGP